MKSGNPALNEKTFAVSETGGDPMTLAGTVNRAFMLLALVVISAAWVWGRADSPTLSAYIMAGCIGGFVVALITIFNTRAAPVTAPIYAVLEGLAIGGVSALYEAKYPGVVMQAVGLTFGTLFCMLAAYKTGLIRATENFKLGVTAATGAIALLYLVDLALMFFGKPISFIHEGGLYGILFSVVVVGIAALNLVMDFDFIESGVQHGSPKYMEWYAAFGLLVTLVWLYLEILRLLSKSRK